MTLRQNMKTDSKSRVLSAINHQKTDRVPVNSEMVEEAWRKLYQFFSTRDKEKILRELEIDCRVIYPFYKGTTKFYRMNSKNKYIGIGGSTFSNIKNSFGSYAEVESYSLDGVRTIEEAEKRYLLPSADEIDYETTDQYLDKCPDTFNLLGISNCFLTLTNSMKMQDLFLNFYENEELVHSLIRKTVDNDLEIKSRILEKSAKKIDAILIADDFATQRGPLISLEMFQKFFKPQLARIITLAKNYGLKIYMHCCGSCYDFIPEFLSLGVDILDPVQTTAVNMQPEKLKKDFGDKITFHGGVDSQHILPHGTQEDVRNNIKYLSEVLGQDGGYILASCHFVQADVPLENILELYRTENRYF